MSITLKTATATTIALTKSKSLTNGLVFQKLGTSYQDLYQLTMSQNVGDTGTAKSRFALKVPYTVTNSNGSTEIKAAYLTVEATIPVDCPVAVAGYMTWLGQSLCADTSFNDLVANRVFSAS